MTIQDKVTNDITSLMQKKDKLKDFEIDVLKVIKAEFQRGKDKTIPDSKAIQELVKMYKSQCEIINLNKGTISGINEAVYFRSIVKKYIPEDVLSQIEMNQSIMKLWIIEHIDSIYFSKKNKGKAIGMVKKHLPYADGELIKDVLVLLEKD